MRGRWKSPALAALLSVLPGGSGLASEGLPQAAPAAPGPHGAAEGAPRGGELLCGERLTIWRKARDIGARECCALVVRSRASLWSQTAESVRLAARARAACPSGLEAQAAVASAAFAAGDAGLAHRHFEELTGGDLEPWLRLPVAIQVMAARAASLSGDGRRALSHYRSSILALGEIASPDERARILLEGAMVAAHLEPPERAEALSYYRQSADQLAPRLAVIRFLVGQVLLPASAEPTESVELLDAIDRARFLLQASPSARGAPGELLPVLSPALLAKILPLETSTLGLEEP